METQEFVPVKYGQYNTLSSIPSPEIVNSMSRLKAETEVISKAIEIFYNLKGVGKSIKGRRKLRCMFYCIYMAYSNLDHPVDPSYAADIVGLAKNHINKAFVEYSPPGAMVIPPEKLLGFYMSRINSLVKDQGMSYDEKSITQGAMDVILVCRSHNKGKEWVLNTASKVVAIVALYFYMNDMKGICSQGNIDIFEKACYLSWACIKRYHEQLSMHYNH